MMKKVDKKKIILSVLLSSMLWSNSLYADELKGDENGQVDSSVEELEKLFEVITIPGIPLDGILQLKNNEKLIINGVKLEANKELTINGIKLKDAVFNNVSEVKNSTVNSVYGGYGYNTNNNVMKISGSIIYLDVAGGAYGESNNHNTLIIEDSEIVIDVFGGGYGSDNNFNKITLINTTAVNSGGSVAGGYYIHDSSVGKITDRVNVKENEVNVSGGDISHLYGGYVSNSNRVIKNINVEGNIVKIDNLGKSSDNSEEVNNIIGGKIGGAVDYRKKVMPDEVKWNSSNNNVEIKNSFKELNTGKNIMGGAVDVYVAVDRTQSFKGTVTANNNRLDIINSYVIAGGVTGGYVSEISDNFTGFTSADNNIVTIDNSTITGLISGGRNDKGQVFDNHIIINNKSVIEGNVIGGYTEYAAVGNTIEISGNNTLDKANLYGYKGINSTPTKTSDNSLKVEDFNGKIKSVNNFEKLEYSNIEWKNEGTVIEAERTENLINAEVIVSGKNGFKLNSGNLNIGETMTLLHSGDDLGIIKDLENGKDFNTIVGVATAVDGIIEQPDAKNITATIKDVKLADQTKLVASNRAVAAAFVNQGTDLIADSLDTLSRDGKYGVKTFAAVHGNRSKYDVNNDIKINGWSTIVGVGAENEHNGGDFSWGVFYENGSGNYRTYNDFNNEFFRGDGSLVYNGGGIAARYENSHGVYTEGSLRAGMLKSEMTDALSDGENKYGYESETAYYGAHIGVGKIFSFGDDSDLDVYGKFFHTYTEGDSFNVAGDEFEFDSINSDRLRIGARVTSNKENKFSTYYGLAYEYEFNGDAEMRAAGMKAPTQSLQGSSVVAEIGLNYQPTPDSPWSFDLNMRGYAGERQGGSFNVQATYTF